ncbi:MAG: transcription termination/antitermination factor NusG [Ruminococcaceae bacterium]|nr:transcription termination/antitermination factor NusG [Oscillospiraceae bacterium]
MASNAKWYVVHTYSGYENKVKTNIEKIVENRHLEDYILEVLVPTEDVVEEKNGKEKIVTRKIFPGYVLIKMVMNDDTWYVVRNTTGITGFVGTTKPIPLQDDEVAAMGLISEEAKPEFAVGDTVKISGGAFEGQVGKIVEFDAENKTVKVALNVFGQVTNIEVDTVFIKSV